MVGDKLELWHELVSKAIFFSNAQENCASIYIKKKKGVRSPECYRYKGSVTHPKNRLATLTLNH